MIRKLITEASLGESFAFGLSVRAWIALSVVWTVCWMATHQLEVKEPLYSLALLTVGFYFGQKTSRPETKEGGDRSPCPPG